MAANSYQDWAEILARLNPASILEVKPTQAMLDRIQYLVTQKNMGALTPEEEAEMAFYLHLETMFGLAKARAHQLLQAA